MNGALFWTLTFSDIVRMNSLWHSHILFRLQFEDKISFSTNLFAVWKFVVLKREEEELHYDEVRNKYGQVKWNWIMKSFEEHDESLRLNLVGEERKKS